MKHGSIMKLFKQKPTKGTKGFLFESPHVVSYNQKNQLTNEYYHTV